MPAQPKPTAKSRCPDCAAAPDAGHLQRRALLLSYFTVGYNILEGIVSLVAGGLAGSIALTGFGLDSFVESLSGGIMIWRFHPRPDVTEEQLEKIEHRAARLVAVTFFLLAAYIIYEAVRKLILREPPEGSLFGIIIAVVSLIAMPSLYLAKQRVGKAIGSRSLLADSRQTLACSLLSASLLVGLLLNYFFRFWIADPIAGLIIAAFLIREGVETWHKEELCNC